MRHIREIENLPVNQLTDEEICKAAMYRLNSNFAMLIYHDMENNRLVFLGRYRKDGRQLNAKLIKVYEREYGKMIRIKTKEEKI